MSKNKTGGGVGTNGSQIRGTAKGTTPRRGRPEDHPAFKEPVASPPAWQAAFDAFDNEPDEQPAPWPPPTEPARHVVVDPFSELQEAARPIDDGGLDPAAIRQAQEVGRAYAEARAMLPDAPISAQHEIVSLNARMRALGVDAESTYARAREMCGESPTGRQILDNARLLATMAANDIDLAAAEGVIKERWERAHGPNPKPAIYGLTSYAIYKRDYGDNDPIADLAKDHELPMAHILAARSRGLQPAELATVIDTFPNGVDRARYLTLRAAGRSGRLRHRRGRTHERAAVRAVRAANKGRRRARRPRVTMPGIEDRRRVLAARRAAAVARYLFVQQ